MRGYISYDALEHISEAMQGIQWEYLGCSATHDPLRMVSVLTIDIATPDGSKYSQEFLDQHQLNVDWEAGAVALRNKVLGVTDGA